MTDKPKITSMPRVTRDVGAGIFFKPTADETPATPPPAEIAPDPAPTPPPAAPPAPAVTFRSTQVRISSTTDDVIARLDAEWKRQGRAGHVSMSAVIRYALEHLDPAKDPALVRKL